MSEEGNKREGKEPQFVQPPVGFIVRRVAAEGPHPPSPPLQEEVPSPWQHRRSSHSEGVTCWVWLRVKRADVGGLRCL